MTVVCNAITGRSVCCDMLALACAYAYACATSCTREASNPVAEHRAAPHRTARREPTRGAYDCVRT